MLIPNNQPKRSKKSGGNVELETLTTFDLYGVSGKTGSVNAPRFFTPSHSLRLHRFNNYSNLRALPRPGYACLITPYMQYVNLAPVEYHGGAIYFIENLQNFARTVCRVTNKTQK